MFIAILILLVGIVTIGMCVSFILSNEKCVRHYEQIQSELQDAMNKLNEVKARTITNRERFAGLRKTMNIKEVMKEMNISRTTAYRYEKWRKENDHTL